MKQEPAVQEAPQAEPTEDETVQKEITLVRHDSLEEIVSLYWHLEENGLTFQEWLCCECGGLDYEGNEVEHSPQDMIDGIRLTGVWGFADEAKGEVHAWIDKYDLPTLLWFFGHEIGHCFDVIVEKSPEHTRSEIRAETYGRAAQQAYLWATEISESSQRTAGAVG